MLGSHGKMFHLNHTFFVSMFKFYLYFNCNLFQVVPVHQDLGERVEQISGREGATSTRLGSLAVGRQLAEEQDGDRRQRRIVVHLQLLELVLVAKPDVKFGRRFKRRSVD